MLDALMTRGNIGMGSSKISDHRGDIVRAPYRSLVQHTLHGVRRGVVRGGGMANVRKNPLIDKARSKVFQDAGQIVPVMKLAVKIHGVGVEICIY